MTKKLDKVLNGFDSDERDEILNFLKLFKPDCELAELAIGVGGIEPCLVLRVRSGKKQQELIYYERQRLLESIRDERVGQLAKDERILVDLDHFERPIPF